MALPTFLTPGYWLNGWGIATRVPEEVQTAPPEPSTVPTKEEPRTAGQFTGNPYGVATVSIVGQTCYPSVPPGDYPVWRAMDADDALTLSRAVITSPIREADKSFEAAEGTPDEWVKLVQDSINPLWDEYLRESLDSLSMGWKPFEPVFGRRENRTVLADLKPLAQELTTVLVKDGVFAGLRNQAGVGGKAVDLPTASSLVVTLDCKNRNVYGRPWHENCRDAWWAKIQCLLALAKLNRKASGIQGKVFFPPGKEEEEKHTNETKAKALLASYMSGDGVVMPNAAGSLTPDLMADFRNIQGLAEAAIWKIEIEDHGNTGAQAQSILDQLRFHNVALSRGWHVPERAAQEANTAGSRADSETSADTGTKASQLIFNDICGAMSRGPIDTLLVENYGEKARGAVKVKAGKLRDIYAAGDWNLIDAFLMQPELAFALAEQIDLDAVVVRRGIPLNKGTLNLVDAIKQAVANRNKQQQAMIEAKSKPQQPANPVNGQANGNGAAGKLALARGTAWLGRILGDEDGDDDHHGSWFPAGEVLALSAGNCGTGAGGFQHGNTCATGGQAVAAKGSEHAQWGASTESQRKPEEFATEFLVTDKADYGDLPPEIGHAINDGVADVLEQLPNLPKPKALIAERGITGTVAGATMSAHMAYDPNDGTIKFDPDVVRQNVTRSGDEQVEAGVRNKEEGTQRLQSRIHDLEEKHKQAAPRSKERRVIKREIELTQKTLDEFTHSTGRSSIGDTFSGVDRARAVAAHEMGHHALSVLSKKGEDTWMENIREAATGRDATLEMMGVSDYAGSNRNEAFAEITAAVATGNAHLVPGNLLSAWEKTVAPLRAKKG